MKNILALLLGIVLATYGTIALADDSDVTFGLSKVSDSKAKLSVWPDGKTTATVAISFDSGADWTDVKDSYSVSSDLASKLESGKASISIGTDGTATFHLGKK
jgi:hypothetical protein